MYIVSTNNRTNEHEILTHKDNIPLMTIKFSKKLDLSLDDQSEEIVRMLSTSHYGMGGLLDRMRKKQRE